jgi:hypothetical protein
MLNNKDLENARHAILKDALDSNGKVSVINKHNQRILRVGGNDYDENLKERKKYLCALEELVESDFLEFIGHEGGADHYELTYSGILMAESLLPVPLKRK